ncbi:MAG: phenylalanine--tRNA ligase subunit beta [Acidimicrobiaceae bacterium]|nr:phenylalanine--tRNA ligase subunit beta [Acidimicrobiaceae bacterium]
MRVPLSWLSEFVDLPDSLDELIAVMDDLGLVVEGVERVGEGLESVVVARVEEIHVIEGADRIRRVVVEAGAGPVEIVCGATNFSVGDFVPLAPVGAVLPGGFEIARRTMRGVVSNGMLCSGRELGLSEDHGGLLLLDPSSTPGELLTSSLALAPDVVLDISIEGNRPDAWSLLGVARDLAARFARSLRMPAVATPQGEGETRQSAQVSIEAPDLCGRFTLSLIRGVRVGPSPEHLARRLTLAGMRPISNVVDASNLVMLELGQPTHAYDADRVGARTLRARVARPGEVLTTLDGVSRALAQPGRGLGDSGEDLVIVDGDDVIHGLAGIMGGALGEIRDSTTEILLEAAFFDPMTIARASKRHGLRSEASHRFERGVDPELALFAAARFVQLLEESVPGLEWVPGPLDVLGELPERSRVSLSDHDIERALGVSLERATVVRLLEGLNFTVREEGGLDVIAPSARLDVRVGSAGRADVIEEIERLYSSTRMPRRTPSWPQPGGWTVAQTLRRRAREVFCALGGHEVWTPTMVSETHAALTHPTSPRIRVANPLAVEESILRPSMIPGLLQVFARNAERGLGDELFGEFGVVFTHPEEAEKTRRARGGAGGTIEVELPEETERFTLLLARPGDDARRAVVTARTLLARLGLDDLDVESIGEAPSGWHPSRYARVLDTRSGVELGRVGEVDPELVRGASPDSRRLGLVDLDVARIVEAARIRERDSRVRVPNRFPAALMDLALVTPNEVGADQLRRVLLRASSLVESVTLFDVYRGDSLAETERSLAYAIRLTSTERTLSDADVADARRALLEAAASLGATLRSTS